MKNDESPFALTNENESVETETSNEEISFESYERITGKRFKLTKAEKTAGLSREEALANRFNEGLEKYSTPVPRAKPPLSNEVWNDPELSLENFLEKTGRRFRISPDQKERGLSREQAFEETRNEKRS